MSNSFITSREASEKLGVSVETLRVWDQKGWIDTIRSKGGKRYYNVEKYLREQGVRIEENDKIEGKIPEKGRLKLAYVRVSTHGQKDDLERQKSLVISKYPKHSLIMDIGSGINFNRKGLRKIIDLSIEGRVEELVVAYKDRLTRFGFELIEDLIKKYSDGKIIIIESKDDLEPEEELVRDVLQLMNVFTAKMNGLRKYKIKKVSETNKEYQ